MTTIDGHTGAQMKIADGMTKMNDHNCLVPYEGGPCVSTDPCIHSPMNRFILDTVERAVNGVQFVSYYIMARSGEEALDKFHNEEGEEFYRGEVSHAAIVGISLAADQS